MRGPSKPHKDSIYNYGLSYPGLELAKRTQFLQCFQACESGHELKGSREELHHLAVVP